MEEYFKKQKRKRALIYFLTSTVLILIVIIIALVYLLYFNIEIDTTPKIAETPKVDVTRLSQTVEQVNKKDKTITEVIEEVNKSIVGISKIKDIGSTIFLQDGGNKLGLGTGMIVSENGYILTNEHVSGQKLSTCYVTLPNGKHYQGSVVWSSSDLDLSVVKINIKNLPYVTLGNSEEISVGQTVYAIGNPIGFEFQRTVTSGIISAINRTILIEEEEKTSYMEDLIQTDATINPGNSGGPLINSKGQVIGINSVKITSAEGIGFAIPINTAKVVVQNFIQNDKFEEASLGIFAYDKNVIPYLDNNLKLDNGIYVAKVSLNSPAANSGLAEKDILISIDNIELNKMCDLRCYIYSKKPGDQVTLRVMRNKKEADVVVTLSKK